MQNHLKNPKHKSISGHGNSYKTNRPKNQWSLKCSVKKIKYRL